MKEELKGRSFAKEEFLLVLSGLMTEILLT
jgi:hypothetical protein